ncbi:DUF4365 domain-containing protein [Nocardia sp. CA-129566]|uniref:DUF4365 domain-containing protein n=1 Tax=Nocardia sp. CA-129566 TaxID=3239976 RepID=UPI003D99EEA7
MWGTTLGATLPSTARSSSWTPTGVTGVAVLAQVKATEVGFSGDSATGFTLRCEADHIAYWTRLGRPVVLICVDLRIELAWWKRVDAWFADAERRARRVVRFDKTTDCFDPDSFSTLSALGVPIGEPLPRLEGSERLVSNLLMVDDFASTIYEASTPCRDRGDAWERMRANDNKFEAGFLLSGGKIYSMRPLDQGPLAVLCDGPASPIPTETWSSTEDLALQRRFVSLLNFTLRSAHHPDLVWHPRKKVVYMQAPPDRSSRKIKGPLPGCEGASFFTPYEGKDDETKTRFCRHYAAGLYFRRWGGQWYLEINPTYHFTIDGHRESRFDAEYVKQIKRLERNNAVYQRFVPGRLPASDDTLFSARDERIRFGQLLELNCDAAIDETALIPQQPAARMDAAGLAEGLWELPS